MSKQRLVNMYKTPDGVILQSKYQHDCQGSTDRDGTYYQVDGGIHGYGSTCNLHKCESLCLYYGDPHEKLREHFMWGCSTDKHGNRIKEHWIKLKDLTDGHLLALIDYTNSYSKVKEINMLMVDEAKWRKLL